LAVINFGREISPYGWNGRNDVLSREIWVNSARLNQPSVREQFPFRFEGFEVDMWKHPVPNRWGATPLIEAIELARNSVLPNWPSRPRGPLPGRPRLFVINYIYDGKPTTPDNRPVAPERVIEAARGLESDVRGMGLSPMVIVTHLASGVGESQVEEQLFVSDPSVLPEDGRKGISTGGLGSLSYALASPMSEKMILRARAKFAEWIYPGEIVPGSRLVLFNGYAVLHTLLSWGSSFALGND
jgi:hypothetical protein